MVPRLRQVYIVDDDDHVRLSMAALLEAADIECDTFASGGEFLEQHDLAAGGCVLLDVHMPGLSGVQVLQALRNHGCKIPVVLLTDRTGLGAAVPVEQLGVTALLSKPVPADDLIKLVRGILAQSDKI